MTLGLGKTSYGVTIFLRGTTGGPRLQRKRLPDVSNTRTRRHRTNRAQTLKGFSGSSGLDPEINVEQVKKRGGKKRERRRKDRE